jgi:exosortase
VLAGLLGLGLIIYRSLLTWDPSAGLRDLSGGVEGFLFEPTGGSPALVFGVAAWLVWRRRERVARCLWAPPFWPAFILLPGSLLLATWAHYVMAPDLLVLSVLLLLPGLGAWLGGRQGFRALLLPGVFLVFAFPMPGVLVNQFMFPLQLWTGELTHALLQLISFPAMLQADQILTQDKIFQVIETCSGLRLMETLTMSAVVYAELLARRPLHAWLLVLLAPCLGTIVNGFRVLSIVLNPYSDLSTVHSTQGIAMLLVGVLLLAGIDRLLEPLLGRVPLPAQKLPEAGGPRPIPALRVTVVGAALAGLASATVLTSPWQPPPLDHRTLQDMPIRLGEWISKPIRVDETYLGSVRFRDQAWRRYWLGDEEVHVFVGLDDRLDRRRSLLSEKTRLPGTGWWIQHVAPAAGLEDVNAEVLLLRSRRDEKLAVHWYEGVEPLTTEIARSFLALDRGPLRRPGSARVVRIATPVEASTQGLVQAQERLEAFLPVVREILAALERGERPPVASIPARRSFDRRQGG